MVGDEDNGHSSSGHLGRVKLTRFLWEVGEKLGGRYCATRADSSSVVVKRLAP